MTQNKSTNDSSDSVVTAITAEQIIQNFDQPDFTVTDLQSTLLKVYNDALANQKNSTLNQKDYYHLYELGAALDDMHAYNQARKKASLK